MEENTSIDEVVQEFLVESHEGLDCIEQDLVSMEERPGDPETLARIFRTVHTIKGTCGFLGFDKLERLNHAAESLMVRIRDGHLRVDAHITSALLATVDATRELMRSIETTGSEGQIDIDSLASTLEALAAGRPRTQHPERPSAKGGEGEEPNREPAATSERVASPERTATPPSPDLARPALTTVAPEPTASSAQVPRAADPLEADEARRAEPEHRGVVETNVRVSVETLDRLMNLVGELVLVRNQILRHAAAEGHAPELLATSQRLNHVTTELQEGIMKTRMQQIGSVWDKFPRVTRDLSRSFSKRVRLEMHGKETELDRTIIEAIRDPLTHLVRNAVDHGIESPDERRRVGKPEEGVIHLRAYHEGGQVNIEIADDGGGLRIDKVKQRAIERGLISPDQAGRMTDREVANLVFLPGFSTADKVTNVSGRGVGMDVVKTNIERIGGTIDIQTQRGRGTSFNVKIPLTLAIIPALLVRTGDDRYAIPQVSLVELVRLEGENARTVEWIHRTPILRLRGNILPLVDLAAQLSVETRRAADELNVVVVQADGQQFGLVVDAIQDTEEIVVKPLGARLKGLDVYAGATIMGDGRVALILDVLGLAQRAQVLRRRGAYLEARAEEATQASENQPQPLLLFECGHDQVVAVPLGRVDRLEELEASAVERSGRLEVLQYRGAILPIASLRNYLGAEPSRAGTASDGRLQLVVFAHGRRRVGLVVDRLLDVVETSFAIDSVSRRRGVQGSAIIQGQVIQMLDVDAVIEDVFPGLERTGEGATT